MKTGSFTRLFTGRISGFQTERRIRRHKTRYLVMWILLSDSCEVPTYVVRVLYPNEGLSAGNPTT